MAANINDLITQATSSSRPSPTQVTSVRAAAGTTLAGNVFTGWPTGTACHFITYKVTTAGAKIAGSQIDMKGIVVGTNITQVVIKAGTDVGNAIGDIIEAAPTAAWANDVVSWGTAQHNQDGTHSAVTATTVTTPSGGLIDGAESLLTMRSQYMFDFVASGCVWSGDAYASTRNASMISGVVFIGGKPVTVATVTARSFTASKDTYIDVDNTGTVTYTEVTNNAASPALSANNIRLGIIVTGATNIAAAGSVNQGQETMVLPIASSVPYAVTDSLGNLICPRDPNRKILGYRQTATSFTATNATTQITGLSPSVIIPSNRKIRITVFNPSFTNTGGGGAINMTLWDGAVGGTQLQNANSNLGSNNGQAATLVWEGTPTSTTKTYNVSISAGAGITANFTTSSVQPGHIIVELT